MAKKYMHIRKTNCIPKEEGHHESRNSAVFASQPENIKIKVVPVHVVKACGGRAPFIQGYRKRWTGFETAIT